MKLSIIIILLMAMLNLVPMLFNTGGVFNVQYDIEDNCGNITTLDGLYFDNVYYILMFLLLSFIGFALPFVAETLNKQIKRVSILLGSWFFSGLLMELFNLTIPKIVLNSNQDNTFYFKVVICFIIGIFVIMSSEIWSSQKKY